ncbi:hypothetical protein DEO72_LG8g995 [Vigna unguiculata]|uniref:Uncharacterized protein n=1 Tax=Vigna unguiculata TaxID=3917 RepID=A0A4D6MPL2_VIGUN|nr:hypothetical protein DEO72_LG8g995 [Vigna unguiculata]
MSIVAVSYCYIASGLSITQERCSSNTILTSVEKLLLRENKKKRLAGMWVR